MDFILLVFAVSLAGSMVSLVAGILLLNKKISTDWAQYIGVPLAAGALLAASFLDLLPEVFEQSQGIDLWATVLAGFLAFFLLERFLGWFHHHHAHAEHGAHPKAKLVIIGDTLHNFIDGLAIGAAFLVDTQVGIVTAVAIAAHEIPQEVGDFGLLLSYGVRRKKVLLINVFSALATVVAALLVVGVGNYLLGLEPYLLAVTAGFFIYVAASDIIPTIHSEPKVKTANIQTLVLVLGVLIVGAAIQLTHGLHGDQTHGALQAITQRIA